MHTRIHYKACPLTRAYTHIHIRIHSITFLMTTLPINILYIVKPKQDQPVEQVRTVLYFSLLTNITPLFTYS